MIISVEQAAINLDGRLYLGAAIAFKRQRLKQCVALWQQAAAIIVVAAKCHFRNRVIEYIEMGET